MKTTLNRLTQSGKNNDITASPIVMLLVFAGFVILTSFAASVAHMIWP